MTTKIALGALAAASVVALSRGAAVDRRPYTFGGVKGTGRLPLDQRVILPGDPDWPDMSANEGYSRGRRPTPQGVILHWPGNSLYHARRLAQYQVGEDGRDGLYSIYVDARETIQTIDLDKQTWHAAAANRQTVGVCIAQPQSDAERARRYGYQVGRITWHGSEYNTLDPRCVDRAAAALVGLGLQFGWAPTFRRGNDSAARAPFASYLARGIRVVNHGDLETTKVDALPWYPAIRARTAQLWLDVTGQPLAII